MQITNNLNDDILHAPKWFHESIQVKAEDLIHQDPLGNLSYSKWHSKTKNLIIFIHGTGAHKKWWDPIAPQLIEYSNVIAIKKYPLINGSFNVQELLLSSAVNLAIAVDLNFNGLIVPVIKNAEKNNLLDLNDRINDLVSRARNNKLSQEEYSGGTYTISNNGSMGTYITAPIVNPPQVAIMSFDGVNKKPVIIEDKTGDTIGIRKVGILGQSFDHRAFDGAYAASFLKEVSKIIEEYDWQSEI